MNSSFKYLRLLGTIFFVLAWLPIAWGIFALLVAPISDTYRMGYLDQKGIGFMGAMAIVFDAALRFLMLMGASQAIKLWLHLEQSIDGLARRLGDVVVATTDIKAGIIKTNADVRMVGSLVYEEAKKDD